MFSVKTNKNNQDLIKIVYAMMNKLEIMLKPNCKGYMAIKLKDVMSKKNDFWFYSFMNKEKKIYKSLFNNLEEFRETLFDADTVVFGNPYSPRSCKPNPYHQKTDEEILMMIDIGNEADITKYNKETNK